MAWPDTSLVVETTLELGADLTADPTGYSFATDITAYTFDRDGDSSVVIQRGRQDESSVASPSSISLTVDNTDGRFVTRNPTGAYYPNLRRNTPLRVRVNPGSGLTTRGVGFTSELPPRWDVAEADHHVPVQADGILRRLSQGQTPLKSALQRFAAAQDVVGDYWSLEDLTGLPAVVPSGVGGVDAKLTAFANTSYSPFDWSADTTLAGSGALPLKSTSLTGGVADIVGIEASGLSIAANPALGLAYWVKTLPAQSTSGSHGLFVDTSVLIYMGTTNRLRLSVDLTQRPPNNASSPNGRMIVDVFALDSSIIDSFSSSDLAYLDTWHMVYARFSQSGADVAVSVRVDDVVVATDTLTGVTLDRVTKFQAGIQSDDTVGDEVARYGFGHAAVLTGSTTDLDTFASAMYQAGLGYAGELAGVRFARLCTEEGVTPDVQGDDVDTYAMGPQTPKNLLDLLRECEAASEGLIVERRTGELGLDLLTHRENPAVALTLNYATGYVSPPLEPIDDDQRTRNDITVTLPSGTSARIVGETGPLSVSAVGTYDESVEINLDPTVTDLPIHHAGWRLNLGTVDGLRWPTVTVNLRRNDDLVAAWLALDIGSRIQITNLPSHISYDDIDLIVEGYTEQISQKNWVVTFNCAPYKPYQVGVLAEDSMTLLTAEDTTSTTWRIACDPSFTTDSADLPVALMVDGEEVSVTAVTPLAVSISAGTAVHGDNASLTPVLPSHVEGDLLLVYCAIRNSGTGNPNLPSGWTSLVLDNNHRVFGKYATSSAETDPLVTFASGAAGDTTSAVAIRARGCQLSAANSKTLLNGSAQDITFPVYVQEGDFQVWSFCWKQDDYTSVATGFGVEVLEGSTTTGNDQSLYVARGSLTTSSPTATGSHTVTGGAAAISRAIWLSLPRGIADLTVTRSVNGVVTSHSRGATVQVAQPMNLAL